MKANAKKWIVLYILAFLIPALLAAGAFLSVRAAYRAQSDRQLAALIGSLIEEYPELDEAEILALLQNERNAPEGEAFLEKYGYYGNMFYSAASGRFARAAFACVLAGSAGTFLCCGGVKLLHDRARRREIEDLTDYLKQIGRGADTLRGYKDDQFRGNSMLRGTAEYRFPIRNKVQGVVFYDIGYAWDKRDQSDFDLGLMESSYGVGLRINSPLGPIKLDWGRGKQRSRFHFSFGGQF